MPFDKGVTGDEGDVVEVIDLEEVVRFEFSSLWVGVVVYLEMKLEFRLFELVSMRCEVR